MKKYPFKTGEAKHKLLTAALFLSLLSSSLTACGSASRSASNASYLTETAAASYDVAANSGFSGGAGMPAAFSKSEAASFRSNDAGDSVEEAAVDAGAYVADSDTFSNGSESTELPQNAAAAQDPTERKLIRNVNLDLETREFDTLLQSVSDAVASFGGYIEQSDVSGNSLTWSGNQSRRSSNMTIRIPADQLDAFLSEVSTQGNITYKNENVQDVTLQYTDITSRKKTLQVEQDRLWALLEKADSVDAVIALESRLSEVRYQLESLESQLRTLDNQVVYSTVYLSIQEVQVLTATDPDTIPVRIQKGFAHSLNQLQTASVDLLVWFVSNLPILIVLAALILVILWILRKIWRKRKLRKNTLNPTNKAKNNSESDISTKEDSSPSNNNITQ